MMPPVIDVIAVSEDKLLYVTDKFLWGKKKTQMRIMFARRKPNSSIVINAMGSCHATTVL